MNTHFENTQSQRIYKTNSKNISNRIWNPNMLTFLSILVAIIIYSLTNYREKINSENAFRKKIICEVNSLYSNSNLLKYHWSQIEEGQKKDNNPYKNKAFLNHLTLILDRANENIDNLNSVLKNDIHIRLIDEKDLFQILSLISTMELNLYTIKSIDNLDSYSLTETQKTIEKILSYEFFLATALRKSFHFNMSKDLLESMLYFDATMKSSYLADYKKINLRVKPNENVDFYNIIE